MAADGMGSDPQKKPASPVLPWHTRCAASLNQRAKYMAVASPLQPPRFLGSIHQLFQLRQFVRSSGLRTSPYFSDRFQLYEYVHGKLAGNEPVDYLEFGVFQGTSIRKWISLNPHPKSRFFGFDTFEGLPEPWVFST